MYGHLLILLIDLANHGQGSFPGSLSTTCSLVNAQVGNAIPAMAQSLFGISSPTPTNTGEATPTNTGKATPTNTGGTTTPSSGNKTSATRVGLIVGVIIGIVSMAVAIIVGCYTVKAR